ncbi:MAG: hypothetical protein AB1414_06050 [bacterium]
MEHLSKILLAIFLLLTITGGSLFALQFAPSSNRGESLEVGDEGLGKDIIHFKLLVEGYGYIYKCQMSDVKCQMSGIEGARVTLYQLNEKSGEWERWLAEEYDQKNPQITNQKGEYGFIVPEGRYLLKVVKRGYLIREIGPFQPENNIVNLKIELVPLMVVFWRSWPWLLVVLLLFVLILLARKRGSKEARLNRK